MRRRLALATLCASTVLSLSGCALLPLACSTIGYISSLSVATDSELADGTVLEICIDGDCTREDDAADYTDSSAVIVEKEGPHGWRIQFGMNRPDLIELALVGEDGADLARDAHELDWVRTGGSERCGGPVETSPVTITAG